MVGSDKLIAGNESGDCAVGNGYEKVFSGDGWEAQHAFSCIGDCYVGKVERGMLLRLALNVAQHARRFAQKDVEVDLGDGVCAQQLVGQRELAVARNFADYGVQAAFALGHCPKMI